MIEEKDVPSERDIFEKIDNPGETTREMYQDGFGDVGYGKQTVVKMRKMMEKSEKENPKLWCPDCESWYTVSENSEVCECGSIGLRIRRKIRHSKDQKEDPKHPHSYGVESEIRWKVIEGFK